MLPCFDSKYIWFTDKNVRCFSTVYHRGIKSGVSGSKNSTISQAMCACALSCWKVKPSPQVCESGCVDVRQERSHIRHLAFNIRKNCTHKKVEVRTKAAHLICASSDTKRPIALKTDSNFTSGMSKNGAKRVQNEPNIIKGQKLATTTTITTTTAPTATTTANKACRHQDILPVLMSACE